MKNFLKVFGIIALALVFAFTMISCGGDDSGSNVCRFCKEKPCVCFGDDGEYGDGSGIVILPNQTPEKCPACDAMALVTVRPDYEIVTVPGFEEEVVLAPSSLMQTWRMCTECEEITYPKLPDGATIPTGAIWLGPWEEDTAIQCRWVPNADMKKKIEEGELNRFYLYVDKENIGFDKGTTAGRYLSTVIPVVNSNKQDNSATWVQNARFRNIDDGKTIPSTISTAAHLAQLSVPVYALINHSAKFDIIKWDQFLQLFVQHSASGGGLSNLKPIAAFIGPPVAGDPAPPPPSDGLPKPVKIMVGSTETTVQVDARNGGIFALDGAAAQTGYRFGTKSTGHRGSFAWFELDLGTKRLNDYKEIKFDVKVIDGEDDSRRFGLMAQTAAFSADLPTHTNNASSSGYLANWQVTKAQATSVDSLNSVQAITLEIDETRLTGGTGIYANLTTTQKLYFSIYEHTSSSEVIEITNIVFVEK